MAADAIMDFYARFEVTSDCHKILILASLRYPEGDFRVKNKKNAKAKMATDLRLKLTNKAITTKQLVRYRPNLAVITHP